MLTRSTEDEYANLAYKLFDLREEDCVYGRFLYTVGKRLLELRDYEMQATLHIDPDEIVTKQQFVALYKKFKHHRLFNWVARLADEPKNLNVDLLSPKPLASRQLSVQQEQHLKESTNKQYGFNDQEVTSRVCNYAAVPEPA